MNILQYRQSAGITRHSLAAALLALGAVLIPVRASALSFVVNSVLDDVDTAPGDSICQTGGGGCTLRAAVQESNALAGVDLIDIAVAGTIKLTLAGNDDLAATGDLDITEHVQITGDGQQSTIIDGGKLDRVFHIRPGGRAFLYEMTIQGGVAAQGGGILCEGNTIAANFVTFQKNTADNGDGGGIAAGSNCSVEIEDCKFLKNSASGSGGGIAFEGEGDVKRTTFEKNKAGDHGGGVAGGGTAVFLDFGSVKFIKNSAGGFGGGVAMLGSGEVYGDTSHFAKNSSGTSGGGIFCAGDCYLSGNSFLKNKARFAGGAIAHSGTSILSAARLSISMNSTSGYGGGVWSLATSGVIASSTFYKNSADQGGGAYLAGNLGTVAINNVTFVANKAGTGGGAINQSNGTVTVENSIITGSSNCIGVVTSHGYNIENVDTCGFNATGDLVNTDPFLAKKTIAFLLEYDETNVTNYVLPPLPGSPAIDSGNNGTCIPWDQRSLIRPKDGDGDTVATCDRGAHELR
jgi:CSLREA domain-containing protein